MFVCIEGDVGSKIFLKFITYMWSHEGNKVRQRQSVWIQVSRAVNCLST